MIIGSLILLSFTLKTKRWYNIDQTIIQKVNVFKFIFHNSFQIIQKSERIEIECKWRAIVVGINAKKWT